MTGSSIALLMDACLSSTRVESNVETHRWMGKWGGVGVGKKQTIGEADAVSLSLFESHLVPVSKLGEEWRVDSGCGCGQPSSRLDCVQCRQRIVIASAAVSCMPSFCHGFGIGMALSV